MLGNAGGTNLDDANTGGKVVGVQVRHVEIKNTNQIDRLGDELRKLRANGLLIGANPVVNLEFAENCRACRQAAPAGNI